VQRPVKFLKYLSQFGYEADVVAGDGAVVPLGDDATLLKECPATRVHRVALTGCEKLRGRLAHISGARWLPWYVEGLGGWVSGAVRTGRKALAGSNAALIFATASPFSVVEAARSLAKRFNLPWVLDLRDPWALDPIHTYSTHAEYKRVMRTMRRAVTEADAVVMNTPNAGKALLDAFPEIDPGKVSCITNGYDPDDFPESPPRDATDNPPFTIAHCGMFHTAQAINLDLAVRRELGLGAGSVLNRLRYRPGKANLIARSPYYLFKAVRKLLDEGTVGAGGIRMLFVGLASGEDMRLAERFGVERLVEWTGYLPHREALEKLACADMLFLPLHEVADNGLPLIVPGKTYEYLGLGLPILGAVPSGDCRDFLEKSGLGRVCGPTDVNGICAVLTEALAAHRAGGIKIQPDWEFIRGFERKNLTERLARVFDGVLEKSGNRTGGKEL